MDRKSDSNGPTGPTDWNAIDWCNANRMVRNLRQRIYRATAEGDLRKVRSLQKLMLRSQANHQVSVRRVAQQNTGANTPGIDRVLVKTPEARGGLVDVLSSNRKVKAHPVRRIYIPKANGKQRPLGIPTMMDRAVQAVVKNALEPEWEARFEATSYGFRPGRSAQDAIQKVFHLSHSGCARRWVVDADIKGCFDNIDHDALLDRLGHFPAKREIRAWLKAGYMESGKLYPTDTGSPQGGVISPLLANVALHGLDEALGLRYRESRDGYARIVGDRAWVRYADDFVVFCKTNEDAEKVVEVLKAWLDERGLTLAEDKTRIVHLEEGFDFLGFNVRQYPARHTSRTELVTLIQPSRKSVTRLKEKISVIWKTARHRPLRENILTLNAVIRGWTNYYRSSSCARTFSSLDHWIFTKAWRYAVKHHPNKGKKWVASRNFTTWGGYRWVFCDMAKQTMLRKFSKTKVVRHVLVMGRASPDDPTLNEYWAKRSTSSRLSMLSMNHQKLARAQGWRCPECSEPLENGERLRTRNVINPMRCGEVDSRSQQLLHWFCCQPMQRSRPEAVAGS